MNKINCCECVINSWLHIEACERVVQSSFLKQRDLMSYKLHTKKQQTLAFIHLLGLSCWLENNLNWE